jgi:hypothetical protein
LMKHKPLPLPYTVVILVGLHAAPLVEVVLSLEPAPTLHPPTEEVTVLAALLRPATIKPAQLTVAGVTIALALPPAEQEQRPEAAPTLHPCTEELPALVTLPKPATTEIALPQPPPLPRMELTAKLTCLTLGEMVGLEPHSPAMVPT